MNTVDALKARKIEDLRAEYEGRGFEVVVDPGPEHVPFDLDGFRPDLLARSSGGNHLVVVRVSGMWMPVDRIMEVVAEVRRNPGWHLTLVTADDVELAGAPGLDDALPSWRALRSQASRAIAVAHGGAEPDAAFFVLWAAVEGVLRKTAECAGMPIERLPTSAVVPHLYSHGAVSMEQYERLISALHLRNRVAHGFGARPDELDTAVKDLMLVLSELLPQAARRAA